MAIAGTTILNLRENLGLEADLQSDCAVLEPMIAPLRQIKRYSRLTMQHEVEDRNLYEFATQASGCGMNVHESEITNETICSWRL